jgi:hypothetical protein
MASTTGERNVCYKRKSLHVFEQDRQGYYTVQVSARKYTAERYDYTVQAWIGTDGRYLCCSHPDSMNCGCYGKAHHGELAPVGHSIH